MIVRGRRYRAKRQFVRTKVCTLCSRMHSHIITMKNESLLCTLSVVLGAIRHNEVITFVFCQINKLDKAVAAANTFFLANPDHMEMKQNLDYYRMMAGVQEEDFKDLEARPHMVRPMTTNISTNTHQVYVDHVRHFNRHSCKQSVVFCPTLTRI